MRVILLLAAQDFQLYFSAFFIHVTQSLLVVLEFVGNFVDLLCIQNLNVAVGSLFTVSSVKIFK